MKLAAFLAGFILAIPLIGRAVDQELASGAGVLSEREAVRNSGTTDATSCSESTIQGKNILWWHRRTIQARKDANKRQLTIFRLKRELRRKYEPSFEHYFDIAAATYGVDREMLERKGRCESRGFTDFYNETPIYNGEHAQGVMGFIPSTFASTPFRHFSVRYDHLANIMAGAWMHKVGRGHEWACR